MYSVPCTGSSTVPPQQSLSWERGWPW